MIKNHLKRVALVATSAVVLSPASALAGTYNALCGGAGCSIRVSPNGISGPGVTIPATRVTSWSMGGQSETDVTTGVVTTVLFGGIGLLGFTAKKHDYNFTVNGYDTEGRQAALSFRFINDKPAKRLASALPGVTGLGMHQRRTAQEIAALESNLQQQEQQLGTYQSPQQVSATRPGSRLDPVAMVGGVGKGNALPTLSEAAGQATEAPQPVQLGQYRGASLPPSMANPQSDIEDWDVEDE